MFFFPDQPHPTTTNQPSLFLPSLPTCLPKMDDPSTVSYNTDLIRWCVFRRQKNDAFPFKPTGKELGVEGLEINRSREGDSFRCPQDGFQNSSQPELQKIFQKKSQKWSFEQRIFADPDSLKEKKKTRFKAGSSPILVVLWPPWKGKILTILPKIEGCLLRSACGFGWMSPWWSFWNNCSI